MVPGRVRIFQQQAGVRSGRIGQMERLHPSVLVKLGDRPFEGIQGAVGTAGQHLNHAGTQIIAAVKLGARGRCLGPSEQVTGFVQFSRLQEHREQVRQYGYRQDRGSALLRTRRQPG